MRLAALILALQMPSTALPERANLFHWFDQVFQVSTKGKAFIDYYPAGDEWRRSKIKGFVLEETRQEYKIRNMALRVGWVPKAEKAGEVLARHSLRDAFLASAASVREEMKGLSSELSLSPLEAFVYSWSAELEGDLRTSQEAFSLAVQLLPGRQRAAKGDISRALRSHIEDAAFQEALDEISDCSVSEAQIQKLLRHLLRTFASGTIADRFRQIERSFSQPLVVGAEPKSTSSREADNLISTLQHLTGGRPFAYEYGFPPGDSLNFSGSVFRKQELSGPAGKLVEMGAIAVPPLVKGLQVEHYTRIQSGDPEHPLLTIGDVCERILEQIAGEVFLDHQISRTPCQSRFRLLVMERVEKWAKNVEK